ncbi:hypothetical protein B0H14DRAFT_1532429 [Mycena olivaceomarginata]|nr:hypothetical protein B0H14DRAFT_1532429 [Mycena olivaceomarginata]
MKLLQDFDWQVRQSAVNCLSSLGAQVEFQWEIRPAISGIMKLLEDSDNDVRQSAVNCLSSLGAQDIQIFLIAIIESTVPTSRWTAILASLPQIFRSLSMQCSTEHAQNGSSVGNQDVVFEKA